MVKERRIAKRRKPIAHATYISANPGWDVVWVGAELPHMLYRHEVVAWRIGTHQRVIPITVDDVPGDFAIEHLGRLYVPAPERGAPSRVYNKVDEYHQARITQFEIDAQARTRRRQIRDVLKRRADKAKRIAKVKRGAS